jgi:hypothetical protein
VHRGAAITLQAGYKTTAGNEYAAGNTYFIEDWTRSRGPNVSSLTLHAIDAWGLLEQYSVPAPWEANLVGDTYTVYQLISKVIQCIGGSLDYVSRSTLMTSLYPRMEFSSGETGAGVLRRLLQLVPDVLLFNGFNAYVLYPQDSDSYVYRYHFPAALSGEHPLLAASYRQRSCGVNRACVIGKDTGDYNVFGEDDNAAEIAHVGERLQFILQTDLLTAALAEDVAQAALARQRIDAASGSLLLPPNCGQELWDVVRINDTPCGQSDADYRITALRLVYDARAGDYYHRLTLGAV